MKLLYFNDYKLGVLKGDNSVVDVTAIVQDIPPRRHCEERRDEAIHLSAMPRYGLLRCARNDGVRNPYRQRRCSHSH